MYLLSHVAEYNMTIFHEFSDIFQFIFKITEKDEKPGKYFVILARGWRYDN